MSRDASPERPRRIDGLGEIAARFDVVLADQFGVLHDGVRPYPGAVEALRGLRDAGVRTLVLSNSGKRAAPNADRLSRLGVSASLYERVLSSGELAWKAIGARARERGAGPRARCLLLARDGDVSAVDGLDIELVDDAELADVVLIAGSTADVHDEAHFRALLAPAARRGTRCLCTNPDRWMLTPGGRRFGAGHIAGLYRELGGPVTWYGKPYPEIYAAALALVDDPPPGRVLCIGDSLEHDVAGGASAGLATLFVRGGIHADAGADELAAAMRRHDAVPDFAIDRLCW